MYIMELLENCVVNILYDVYYDCILLDTLF